MGEKNKRVNANEYAKVTTLIKARRLPLHITLRESDRAPITRELCRQKWGAIIPIIDNAGLDRVHNKNSPHFFLKRANLAKSARSRKD